MFILLKKNKKYFTILLIIILIFIVLIKINSNLLKKFDDTKYKDDQILNQKELNQFFSNYKEFNEHSDFKNIKVNNILPRVAHATGGFKDTIYTNSIDALEKNKKDFLFFEIDFFLTDDGKVVCEHKEHKDLKSLESFNFYIKKNKVYQQCTYITLNDWLIKNPKKYIITDFKKKNLKGLEFISKNFNDYQDRFIPQIYHPNEYLRVKKLGFKNIIWTLYKYKGSNDSILLYSKNMKLFAITMDKIRARSGLALKLKEKNIYTYVHTINSISDYYKYLKIYKVDQIYTDWIK